MRQEGFDAANIHQRAARNQQPMARDHQAGGQVVAKLDRNLKVLQLPTIGGDHCVGTTRHLEAIGDRVFGSDVITAGQFVAGQCSDDRSRLAQQRPLDHSIERTAELDKLAALSRRQERKLQIKLLLLFPVELVQHGIFEMVERN